MFSVGSSLLKPARLREAALAEQGRAEKNIALGQSPMAEKEQGFKRKEEELEETEEVEEIGQLICTDLRFPCFTGFTDFPCFPVSPSSTYF